MTLLYIVVGVVVYLAVGILVIGMGRRRMMKTPFCEFMSEDAQLELGGWTLIWPLVVAFFAAGILAISLGDAVTWISTIGKKEKK